MDSARFWEIIALLDWEKEDDDDVLLPAIEKLAGLDDQEIFSFDDIMAGLLYDIDGRVWAEDIYRKLDNVSSEDFLYTRCVAIIKGKAYYDAVKNHTEILEPNAKFEAILYAPPIAWAVKHDADVEGYPHETKFSFETGSNTDLWRPAEADR